jgi:hypothetical protein
LAQQYNQNESAEAAPSQVVDAVDAEGGMPTSPQDAGMEAAGGTPAAQFTPVKRGRVDLLALSMVVLMAAIFSIAGRLYTQPTTSSVPVAVIGASGCGLLVSALRKLRANKGVGLLEAGLAGLFVAALQFLVALSYPGVLPSLGDEQLAGPGFFTTWALIALFAALFSMIGAALGHLAFAPLRPLPAGKGRKQSRRQVVRNDSSQDEARESARSDEEPLEAEGEETQAPGRTWMNYAITVLMLGLIPMLAGYVFSAAFDYALLRNGYAPGPFPTLRLLSALLPWQVPDPVGLQGASTVSLTITLLWRIPLFFGNPAPFDAQALEPLIFNAAGLGLLLMTSLKQENGHTPSRRLWSKALLLEALFGLALVLPADLWMMQGLEGILKFQGTAFPLGTLRLLDPLTFALNLITGPLICLAVGTFVTTRVKRA